MPENAGWQFAVEVHPPDWRFPAGPSWLAGWIFGGKHRLVTDLQTTGPAHVKSDDTDDFVLYLAVVPHYRQACVDELYRRLGGALTIYAGRQHMDDTVTTRIRADQYTEVRNRFFGFLFGYDGEFSCEFPAATNAPARLKPVRTEARE